MATSAVETAKQENGSLLFFKSKIENNKEPSAEEMFKVYDGYNSEWKETYRKQVAAVKKYIGSQKGYEYSRDKGIMPFIENIAKTDCGVVVKDRWDPMDIVMVKKNIYDSYQNGDPKVIDLFHGYTYSAHPLASAALIATLDVYRKDGLFDRVKDLAPYWEDALHSLKGTDNIIDIRNLGLVGGVEMNPKNNQVGLRGYDVFEHGFHKKNS